MWAIHLASGPNSVRRGKGFQWDYLQYAREMGVWDTMHVL